MLQSLGVLCVDWCRKRVAEGEDPEYLADALRSTLREEVASSDEVEVELQRVMKLVRAV